jgi:hypothetical protein
MDPHYVAVPSTGAGTSVSPWFPVDRMRNPIAIGFSIISESLNPLSSGATPQVTSDGITWQFPNPLPTE